VVMKRSVIAGIMPCSLLKVNWCFRGTCHPDFQGQRNSRALLSTFLLHAGLLLGLLFDPEDGGILLQKAGGLSADYKAFYYRTYSSSNIQCWLWRHWQLLLHVCIYYTLLLIPMNVVVMLC
jgi:hypothetical protein